MLEKLYTTDLKFIIPIIGIVLAWILSSAANFYKQMNSNKMMIGRSLVNLYFFYEERLKLIALFEYLKSFQSNTIEYEDVRMRYMDRCALSDAALKTSIDSIEDISALYPFIGFELKPIVESYTLKQKMSFKNSSRLDSSVYIELISIYEVSLEIENKILRKIILKLAYKRGIITWIRMKRKLYIADIRISESSFSEYL